MNFIRRFLGFKNATNIVIPKGQRVIIVEGALSGFEGTVIQQYKSGNLDVSIIINNKEVIAELKPSHFELITSI